MFPLRNYIFKKDSTESAGSGKKVSDDRTPDSFRPETRVKVEIIHIGDNNLEQRKRPIWPICCCVLLLLILFLIYIITHGSTAIAVLFQG